MPRVETLSKIAALVSLIAIAGLQLALHPGATWPLRVAGVAAFAAGWLAARPAPSFIHSFWVSLAALAPAVLPLVFGRQGPIVETVWMAGLAGSLARAASWSRWTFPPLWSVLLGGWALALSLAWPVLVAREAAFDLHALRDGSAINSWSDLPAPEVIAWTLYVVQIQLLGLLWFDWIYAQFAARSGRLPQVVHGLWVGVTLASIVALVQGAIDLTFLNVEFWVALKRATGTMLDANAYGVAAAIAGPVALLALSDSRWPWAGPVVMAVNWGGLWMSGSRTALLCAALAGAGLAIGALRSGRLVLTPRRMMAAAALIVAAGVLVVSADAIGPAQRIATARLNKEGLAALWSRGGYGTIAVQMVREYPATGVGVGAYRYLAPDYWRVERDDRLQVDNAQNWWRHQAAELGLSGGGLVLLWSALIAWLVVASRPRPAQELAGWTVRGMLLGIGACSLVGMPTQNPVVLLWFFFLVAWADLKVGPYGPEFRAPSPGPRAPSFDSRVARPEPRAPSFESRVASPESRLTRPAWVVAVLLALVYAGGHLLLAKGPLSLAARAERFHRDYVEGAYPLERLPDGREFRWTRGKARFVLVPRTRWMVMRLWASHPDIDQRPVRVTVSALCGEMLQRDLRAGAASLVAIALPEGIEMFDASFRVSRTWSPAEQGSDDARQLGVAVETRFVQDHEIPVARDQVLEWRDCSADG